MAEKKTNVKEATTVPMEEYKSVMAHVKECHNAIREMRGMLQVKRLDYLFKLVDPKYSFSSDAVTKAAEEIEATMFPVEKEDKNEA